MIPGKPYKSKGPKDCDLNIVKPTLNEKIYIFCIVILVAHVESSINPSSKGIEYILLVLHGKHKEAGE